MSKMFKFLSWPFWSRKEISGRESNPRPFSEKTKLSIYLDKKSQILYSLFLLFVQVDDYQNILKLRYWPLSFNSDKAFLKSKTGLEPLSLPSFLHDFLRKIFLTRYVLLTDQILLYDSWDIGQYMYCNLFPNWWYPKFWNLDFYSSRFPKWAKKLDKNLNILRRKGAFKMK